MKNKGKKSSLREDFINLLFPTRCVLCGKSSVHVCLSCRKNFPYSDEEGLEEGVTALFSYRDDKVKHVLWLLKYKNVRALSRFCAEMLYEKILEDLADLETFSGFENPLLVPIPLSRKRLRFRGFNQSGDMAKHLARLLSYECDAEALQKIKETRPQMTIRNRKERLENVIGCYAVTDAEKIKGRNIILIDDITTTGATLHEAKKALENAGANTVIAYAVAH